MMERLRPRAELERMLDEMDRLLATPFRRGRLLPRMTPFRPAIDLYETPDALIVKALVPGAKPEDIHISLEHTTLTIRGTYGYALPDDEENEATWHFREAVNGEFTETLTLPAAVDPDAVTATVEQGILTLKMPKSAETRARHIPVHGAGALVG